jgi:hypothetical protein
VNALQLWRERWRTWVPALGFFLFNIAALLLYQFVFSNRVALLEDRVQALTTSVKGLAEQRADLEKKAGRVDSYREQIAALYRDRFSTERQRLTRTLAEFKKLATEAGLQPQSVSYPEQELAEYGLVKK